MAAQRPASCDPWDEDTPTDTERVELDRLDFAQLRLVRPRARHAAGTADYMTPEQVRGLEIAVADIAAPPLGELEAEWKRRGARLLPGNLIIAASPHLDRTPARFGRPSTPAWGSSSRLPRAADMMPGSCDDCGTEGVYLVHGLCALCSPEATPDDRIAELAARLRERNLLDIVSAEAASSGVALDDVLGRWRTPRVVRARHAVWRSLSARFSSVEIGRIWGVHHTAVLGALGTLAKCRRPAMEARAS